VRPSQNQTITLRPRALTAVLAVTLAAIGLAATGAFAAAPKLSLHAVGVKLISIANLHLYDAATGTPLRLDASVHGSLPSGTSLRLAEQTIARDPFKVTGGAIRLHGGNATLTVNATIANTTTYRLETVTSHGQVLAHSAGVPVFWIAPPTELVVTDDGDQSDLDLHTGALTCFPQSAAGAANTCVDKGGSSSGGEEPLGAFVNPTDMPPGASIALSFNGRQICSADTFDGTCEQQYVGMPTVSTTTYFPAVATYTSPSGAMTSVTLSIVDYP
jgi:hypothetical protein